MSRLDGLKQQEISDQLGISVKTIKNQIWKSLQYLKACLELKDAF
jgi:RNA polymerase sigma-70 factor (ECF subfamily)